MELDRASSRRRGPGRWVWLGPALAVVAAGAVVIWTIGSDGGSDRTALVPTTSIPGDGVEVSSDAPRFESMAEMAAASDVVVRGTVASIVRGRWFGDGDAAIESRLVTVEVTEVLAGNAPGDTILIEEEGWDIDGRPLVVDRAAPTALGQDVVWFLVDGGDPTVEAAVTVGPQGRFLVGDDGTLTPWVEGDEMSEAVAEEGLDALVEHLG